MHRLAAYSPWGRETPKRRFRRVGLASFIMTVAVVSMLVFTATVDTGWQMPPVYRTSLTAIAVWLAATGCYALYETWRTTKSA
jgi:hypothetical protein